MQHTPTHSRILSVAAVLVALALATGPVAAQGGPPPGGSRFGDGPPIGRLFDRLDLTDEQRSQVEQIVADHREGSDVTHERMRAGKEALAERIHAETFDESAIRAAAAEVAAVEADLAVARATLLQQLRGVLSPDQAAEMEQMMQHRRDRLHARPARAHGPHHRHRRGADGDF